MKCCICGHDRSHCHVVKTTEAEREAIQRMGQEPQEEYAYCRPCYRLLSDKEHTAQFMQGIVQTRLQMSGPPRAAEIAKKYYEFFIKARGPVS
jgi:hypothetical protein